MPRVTMPRSILAAGSALEAQLGGDKPWDDLSTTKSCTQKLKVAYRETRETLLNHQVEIFEAERPAGPKG